MEPDFNKTKGLIPAIVQDAGSGEVLMLAYMNREAWEQTCKTGRATFFSRSRNKLWVKGETSGNVQELASLHADCDGDALLARVRPRGPACHTGDPTCFGALPAGETPEPAAVLAGPPWTGLSDHLPLLVEFR